MINQTKAILLVLMFLSNYLIAEDTDHNIFRDRLGKPGGGYKPKGSGITVKGHKNSGDTLWLPHDRTYALFSGTPIEVSHSWWKFKINSVIRGDFDTTGYWSTTIGLFNLSERCPTKIEANKNYLVLNVLLYRKEAARNPSAKCEDVLPDTPENREILIKKYEKTIIIKEPKPDEAKK
jgi:hypothetical protein